MAIQLSYSAAQRYLTSPRSYYLHYILKLRPSELSSALLFGNAVDQAVNLLLTQKQEEKPINLEEAKQVFLTEWIGQQVNGKYVDLRRPGVVKFSKADLDESLIEYSDIPADEARAWHSLYEKGNMILEAYVAQVLPRIQKVLFVQKNIHIKNPDGDAFVGLVDFCAVFEDGKTYIFDNKTSSVKYAANATDESEQLATYYEALRDTLTIDGVGYVVLPKAIRKKKLPLVPIEIMVGPVHEAVIERTFEMYDGVLEGVKLGKFPCTPDKCCSTPWGCSYRRYCESDGQDTTGLVSHEKKT